jgi:hypothetical protein
VDMMSAAAATAAPAVASEAKNIERDRFTAMLLL